MRQRMCRLRTRDNIKVIQQRLTHQMWRSVAGIMHPDIGGGFAVVNREQLRVHIGHMYEMYVAEPR